MKSNFDWNVEAKRAVSQTSSGTMFSAHRGAMKWEIAGVTVIFGNDGHTTERVKDELSALRGHLAALGVKEAGFATTDDEYSWAMIVHTADEKAMHDAVWAAWSDVVGRGLEQNLVRKVQGKIAEKEIGESAPRPDIFPN